MRSMRWMILTTGRNIALPSRTACAPCSMTGRQSSIPLQMLLSSSCMEGTWKLEVASGTQKQLRYWSSDFKYRCKKPSEMILLNRNGADVLGCTFTGFTFTLMKYHCCTFRNDADVVAVRNGCTFTGWTGSGYNGETFTVTGGPGPRDR